MMRKLLIGGLAAAGLAVAIQRHDIVRYLRIKQMSLGADIPKSCRPAARPAIRPRGMERRMVPVNSILQPAAAREGNCRTGLASDAIRWSLDRRIAPDDPVVAPFLELLLQHGEGDPVGPVPFAVNLYRAGVRLREQLLSFFA
jgi:hypothetical protein